ncbi:uncharacterized protein V6R79_025189 [Siganus canaliculatus]
MMSEGGEEIGVVADIIATPFSRWTFQEKMDIVRQGWLTPELASLSQQGKGFVRHCQSNNYERYQLLTASPKRGKLYCWECLLFASDRFGVWSNTGFANLSCLTKAATRHQITAGHLQATGVFWDSKKNINDPIYAVAEVIGDEIKIELKSAPFVAVMVDETTDVGNMAQLALVLRYVTATGVKERFVKFVDITSGRRADDLAALIFNFFKEYECCLDKVDAQCHDGAATKTLDVQFCMARENELCHTVRGKFSDIYEETVRVSGVPVVRRGQGAVQNDLRAHYQRLHTGILDNSLSQIQNQFQDHKMLMFLSLLNPQHFQTYKTKFPQSLLQLNAEPRSAV